MSISAQAHFARHRESPAFVNSWVRREPISRDAMRWISTSTHTPLIYVRAQRADCSEPVYVRTIIRRVAVRKFLAVETHGGAAPVIGDAVWRDDHLLRGAEF